MGVIGPPIVSGKEKATYFSVKTWTTDWFSQSTAKSTSGMTKTTDFSVEVRTIVWFWLKILTTDCFSENFTDSILQSTPWLIAIKKPSDFRLSKFDPYHSRSLEFSIFLNI